MRACRMTRECDCECRQQSPRVRESTTVAAAAPPSLCFQSIVPRLILPSLVNHASQCLIARLPILLSHGVRVRRSNSSLTQRQLIMSDPPSLTVFSSPSQPKYRATVRGTPGAVLIQAAISPCPGRYRALLAPSVPDKALVAPSKRYIQQDTDAGTDNGQHEVALDACMSMVHPESAQYVAHIRAASLAMRTMRECVTCRVVDHLGLLHACTWRAIGLRCLLLPIWSASHSLSVLPPLLPHVHLSPVIFCLHRHQSLAKYTMAQQPLPMSTTAAFFYGTARLPHSFIAISPSDILPHSSWHPPSSSA